MWWSSSKSCPRRLSGTGQHGESNHQLDRPEGVAVNDGLVYVTDSENQRLHVYVKV